jgi:hypothetical protein
MRNKHTPAPWFAVQYANEWNIQSEDGYEGVCTNVLDEEEDENHEANAQLIAAAPELLQMLIELNQAIDDYWNSETKPDILVRHINMKQKQSLKLINKATGKEVSNG